MNQSILRFHSPSRPTLTQSVALAVAAFLLGVMPATETLARMKKTQQTVTRSSTKSYTIGSGGHDVIDDFADGGHCELIDLNGAADGLFDHGDTVDIVKSFDVGNVLPAQLVTTVGATTEGTFSLDPFAGGEDTPIVLLIVPHDSGVDAFRVLSGSITITGLPNSGDAELFFDSLIMGQVVNGTQAFIKNGPCYSFWDFTLDGVVTIPGSWTCADELYTDASCHCGCGAIDPSCERIDRCDVCGADGSCAEGMRGCETIDPRHSGSCVEPEPEPEPEGEPEPEPVTYDDDIAPIISNRCAICHNDSYQPVLSYAFLMSEVSTDDALWALYPAYANYDFNVVPGSPADSMVWNIHIDGGTMPPGEGLGDAETAVWFNWINQGALEN